MTDQDTLFVGPAFAAIEVEHDETLATTAHEMEYSPNATAAVEAMLKRAKADKVSLEVIMNDWLIAGTGTDKRNGIGFSVSGDEAYTDYWIAPSGHTMMRHNYSDPRLIRDILITKERFKREYDAYVDQHRKPGPIDPDLNAIGVAKLFSS